MSEYIHKAHNVSVLIYHIVCPAKYRRVVISEGVDQTLKETCEEISKRFEIQFLEIGTEVDHVHFLVQEVFKRHPEIKEKLWGGEFWSDGHFVSTVGKHGNEETIANYVKAQETGKDYKQLYKIKNDENQPSLFN